MDTLEHSYAVIMHLVNSLVDHPESATVTIHGEPPSIVFRFEASPEDIGKLIGKQGRTARSIRTIVSGMGMKLGMRFSVDIVEQHQTAHPSPAAAKERVDKVSLPPQHTRDQIHQ